MAGACKVRVFEEGQGKIPYYGYITGMGRDPIEKKPLYHFRPGSLIFSLGFTGCNLHCPFCQNWAISQTTRCPGKRLFPGDILSALGPDRQIAYTYSEPLIHAEFLEDCMRAARERGIANVLVSNGCVNEEAAETILDLCDAANIDLKSFSAETYARVLGGDLETVLAFLRKARFKGVHLEITTLVVPGLNDSGGELEKCARFIADLSRDESGKGGIPWHLSAYHPDWRWKAPPTSPEHLKAAAARAREELRYVYAGNIPGEYSLTHCPRCGAVLVSRRNYRIDSSGLTQDPPETPPSPGKTVYRCARCGAPSPVRF
jgi:pyruvate formate lyase activating enzyme